MAEGQGATGELGSQHCREQPGADDVVRLRSEIERVEAGEEVDVAAADAASDLGRKARCRPGVEDIAVADEAAGLAPLLGGKPR